MLFLPITFLLYFNPLIQKIAYRNAILLIASLVFYAWGEPKFTLIMIGSIIIDWIIGLAMENKNMQARKKLLMIIAVVIHLGILFVFKYLSFTTAQLSLLFSNKVADIALPIGISFFTFQMMSYVFDVYYGKVEAQKNPFKLALYITMFPQLIAGPIVRYQTIAQEIDARSVSRRDIYEGLNRFIIGVSKKVLLADLLGITVERIFSTFNMVGVSGLAAWVGAIAYTFEIYFDFSGYSDMAIGLARCFGFHFEENFKYPYVATSITEFWKRWHVSLTNWFRDYVYIPLGGNRVGPARHIINLSIVWLLTGIWHGANWTFILWGIIYLIFQIFEKYCGKFYFKVPAFIRWILAMLVVICNWVIFRSDTVTLAFGYLKTMFGGAKVWADETSRYFLQENARLFIICFLAALPWKSIYAWLSPRLRNKPKKNLNRILRSQITGVLKDLILLVFFLLVILFTINGSYSPFIYFNF